MKNPLNKIILFLLFVLFLCFCLVFLSPRGNKYDKNASKFSGGKDIQSIILSVDLCPSSRPYEARLFDFLDDLGRESNKPVPVAVAVSGKWILKHKSELEAIKSKKYLDITWVNHSYSHSIEEDFLNNPKVNFSREVKANLALMKKYGLKPSQYFRFPGLVHNKERLSQLQEMGYINLDADAWLGKGREIIRAIP